MKWWVLASCACAVAVFASASSAQTWNIVSIDGAAAAGEPRMTFSPDGALSVSTGCNRLRASGRMDSALLVIDAPVAAEKIACPDAALAAQESAILTLLRDRVSVAFDPVAGVMTLAANGVRIALSAAPATSGPEPWPTHAGRDRPAGDPPYLSVFGLPGPLSLRAGPASGAEVLGEVAAGTVLRNRGCSGGWCQVELPDGSLAGWADAERLEPANTALRAGRGIFDATGIVPCAKGAGMPSTACPFGVARSESGEVTVVVRRPDGLNRALFFLQGQFAFADTSEAGVGRQASVRREAGLNLIRVGDERYEIPDAVASGG
ncbi:MAG: META domain-containing protein [Burkholderiales bacterium]|nr:MAG: META domain-containing protein [Burkholderiales bacterium]